MKRFIVIYNAPPDAWSQMATATPEQQAEGMKPWFAWKDSLGDKLVDFGSPLVGGIRLLPDGTSEKSKQDITGYSMLQATDMEEAKKLLKNHPHLTWTGGCDIEVYECAKM